MINKAEFDLESSGAGRSLSARNRHSLCTIMNIRQIKIFAKGRLLLSLKAEYQFLPIIIVLLLGACQGITIIDGQASFMSKPSTLLRQEVGKELLPEDLAIIYRVGTCIYQQQNSDEKPPQVTQITVSMRQIKDGIQVVSKRPSGETSVWLMNNFGKILDFNSAPTSSSFNQRSNPENFVSIANEQLRLTRQSDSTNLHNFHVVNEIGRQYPSYNTSKLIVGQEVASVVDERGSVWGTFVYRGITKYKNVAVGLVDLYHPSLTGRTKWLVGFNLIDIKFGYPVLSLFDSGKLERYEQISCL